MNILKRAISVSAIGLASIMGYEGVSLVAYKDPVGIPTICYGYTENVFMGMTRTKQECVYMLETEVDKFTKVVLNSYSGPLSQGELDAYVSFTYNVGAGAWQNSTLLKKLKSGNRIGACDELLRWVYAKGKKLPGLISRRAAEHRMCVRGARADMG